MGFEREVKIKVDDLEEEERKVRKLGAVFLGGCFEKNYLFDRENTLFKRGEALRLRICPPRTTLTFKGRPIRDPQHKVREEIQTEVDDPRAMEDILKRLGFSVAFYYEKERKNYRLGKAMISLDRTPLGNFIEIEGSPEEIESIARSLGFSPAHYIKKTYVEMALEAGLKEIRFSCGE